jgi:hypothetical protein
MGIQIIWDYIVSIRDDWLNIFEFTKIFMMNHQNNSLRITQFYFDESFMNRHEYFWIVNQKKYSTNHLWCQWELTLVCIKKYSWLLMNICESKNYWRESLKILFRWIIEYFLIYTIDLQKLKSTVFKFCDNSSLKCEVLIYYKIICCQDLGHFKRRQYV